MVGLLVVKGPDCRDAARRRLDATRTAIALAALVAGACTGAIGETTTSDDTPRDGMETGTGTGGAPGKAAGPGPTSSGGGMVAKFACNTGRATATPLRRLSVVQYK